MLPDRVRDVLNAIDSISAQPTRVNALAKGSLRSVVPARGAGITRRRREGCRIRVGPVPIESADQHDLTGSHVDDAGGRHPNAAPCRQTKRGFFDDRQVQPIAETREFGQPQHAVFISHRRLHLAPSPSGETAEPLLVQDGSSSAGTVSPSSMRAAESKVFEVEQAIARLRAGGEAFPNIECADPLTAGVQEIGGLGQRVGFGPELGFDDTSPPASGAASRIPPNCVNPPAGKFILPRISSFLARLRLTGSTSMALGRPR